MYYGNIKKCDISNGPGTRVSLFVSGCIHQCKGCFNPETWDFYYGKEFTEDTIKEILDAVNPDYIHGLTILGGEPLIVRNRKSVLDLIKEFRKLYPNKTIWVYSGYTLEELTEFTEDDHSPYLLKILSEIDVLVDGRFVEDLKDITLRFRGSSNQRIIDMKQTQLQNKIVLYDLED